MPKWSEEADKDLLLSIITTLKDKGDGRMSFPWEDVKDMMASRGYAFTKDSVR